MSEIEFWDLFGYGYDCQHDPWWCMIQKYRSIILGGNVQAA